jgi:non-specific serine/threonine protein kinase
MMNRNDLAVPSVADLPAEPTPLIGRDDLLDGLARLLHPGGARLVTLTGAAGVGKTRLAIRAARDARPAFPDGVDLVLLASVTDPARVLSAVAAALGLPDGDEPDVAARLRAHLQRRRGLLVLDNFEQVVSAAVQIGELVSACPLLSVLVTSRAALRLRSEREVPVPPLALPGPGDRGDPEALARAPAAALLVDRAQAVDPAFRLTDGNAADVADICRRLDGLPLAIELAAARLRVLSPATVRSLLGRPLDLLTEGPSDLPGRHRTLRAAIRWSHDLLDDRERRLLRWLAAFPGGSTPDAAMAVGAVAGVADPLDVLGSLVDKSLLRRVETTDGESRVAMLETVREYALERLAASGESEPCRAAQAAWCLGFAEGAAAGLRTAQAQAWLERLEAEHENLRAALRWGLDVGDAEAALRLAAALWRFWYTRGHLTEGRRWLEAALEAGPASDAARAGAMAAAGVLAHYQGDLDRARSLAGHALLIARAQGDRATEAAALLGLALVARTLGDYSAAVVQCDEALAAQRAIGDDWALAHVLTHRAFAAWMAGDDDCRAPLEEALAKLRRLGDRHGVAYVLDCLSFVAVTDGRVREARALADEGLGIARALGDRRGVSRFLTSLGDLALAARDPVGARDHYVEALEIVEELGDQWFASLCLLRLAEGALLAGDPDQAVRLLSASTSLRESSRSVLPPHYRGRGERTLSAAREALGAAAVAAAWAEGRGLTPGQVAAGLREAQAAARAAPPGAGLTPRERDVLRLVARGMTDAQVAGVLVLSPRTVNTHLRSIYRKLGVASRTAAARRAMDEGIG